jgi:hypothetical protein
MSPCRVSPPTPLGATLLTLAALAAAAAAAPAPCLPLLPRGGLLVGASYSRPADAAAGNRTDALFAEIVARGGRLVQLSLPWADVEPVPKQPNYVLVAEILASARAAGLVPLFQLAAIDTEHASVPPDLANPSDPTRLRPGLEWNASELIDRYATVLEVVAPLAAFSGAPYFGLGNEVSVNLRQRPETAFAFAEFAFTMRKFVQQLTSPDLSVGVTMTVADLFAFSQTAVPEWASLLFDIADVVPLTYYAIDDAFRVVTDRATVEATFLGAASVLPAGACLVLQELGMPSGYGNASSVDGGSQAAQAAFVADFREVLAKANSSHEVRAASFYELVDMSDADCESFARYYNTSDPAFVEYLCTLGLVRQDGVAKAGFAAFLQAFL